MKLSHIIIILGSICLAAGAHASKPGTQGSTPFISKAFSKVVPVQDPDDDNAEEMQMTFFEKAWANARDCSPFAFRLPDYTPAAGALLTSPLAAKMVDYAARYIGSRYRLGASGPAAFDCSGFTGWIYRHFGMQLERSSRSQYTQGEKVDISDVRPGDLLFFSSRSSGRGNVGHVGMVVSVDNARGTLEFIHASTRRGVVYQSFPDNAYYSRNFLGARRMLGTEVSAGIADGDALSL